MKTLGVLREETRQRLGDLRRLIWPDDEIDIHLRNGYQTIANDRKVFWDWTYLDNLPRGFSYTQPWEAKFLPNVVLTIGEERPRSTGFSYTQPWEQAFLSHLTGVTNDLGPANFTSRFELELLAKAGPYVNIDPVGPGNHTNTFEETDGDVTTKLGLQLTTPILRDHVGGFDFGHANYTYPEEFSEFDDARTADGPANHTSPFEVLDGLLTRSGASGAIPATADLPATITSLERVTWDKRGIDAMTPNRLQNMDSRYELTEGEVYGYMWQKDGIRTLRKIRVPAQQCDTVAVDGSWGLCRSVTALGLAPTSVSTWGTPRRLAGHHPLGAEHFGGVRQFHLEGKNVRVEHYRQGRTMTDSSDICELPERYADYLRDYAMAQCLSRPGPGQDLELAQHFTQRWARGMARVARRIDMVDRQRTVVLGGDGQPMTHRPPRPSMPWPYGSVVRR